MNDDLEYRKLLFRIIVTIFMMILSNVQSAFSMIWHELPHSKIRIVNSDQEKFLAIEFKIDQNWYIYGPNPGELGVATTIKPINNDIFISKYHWPVAHKKNEFDGLVSYIYKDQIIVPFVISDNKNTEFEISYLICGDSCIPVTTVIKYEIDKININNQDRELIKKFMKNNEAIKPMTIWMILIVAFSGGIILNFMPCVLPILSIKLMSIINNNSNDYKNTRKNFISSACGIIFSFVLIAIIIIILSVLGKQISIGMHFQEPVFIITMIIITFLFGLNLCGNYQINLPRFLYNFDLFKNDNKHKLISNFLNGMFASILATPCSAPFIGTAVGFALSQSSSMIILIFTIMGIGFSAPYIMLAIFPKSISFIPRSGEWTLKLKYIFGYLLYLTTFWLLFVLTDQLTILSSILLFGLLILLKFFLEKKLIPIALIVIILCYYIPKKEFDNELNYQKYVDDVWHEFEAEKIPDLIKSGKIVLIDITANWCITCKINKFTVLDRVDILSYLTHPKLYAMRADITKNNPKILKYMKNFDRYGIPFNIVYGPKLAKPIILSELLTKKSLINALVNAGF